MIKYLFACVLILLPCVCYSMHEEKSRLQNNLNLLKEAIYRQNVQLEEFDAAQLDIAQTILNEAYKNLQKVEQIAELAERASERVAGIIRDIVNKYKLPQHISLSSNSSWEYLKTPLPQPGLSKTPYLLYTVIGTLIACGSFAIGYYMACQNLAPDSSDNQNHA